MQPGAQQVAQTTSPARPQQEHTTYPMYAACTGATAWALGSEVRCRVAMQAQLLTWQGANPSAAACTCIRILPTARCRLNLKFIPCIAWKVALTQSTR